MAEVPKVAALGGEPVTGPPPIRLSGRDVAAAADALVAGLVSYGLPRRRRLAGDDGAHSHLIIRLPFPCSVAVLLPAKEIDRGC